MGRTIAIGFGGARAVIASGGVGNLIGGIVEQVMDVEWSGHASFATPCCYAASSCGPAV